jgi:hypothetical protein
VKIKEWLRKKLKQFLNVDKLEIDYKSLLSSYHIIEMKYRDMQKLNKDILDQNEYIMNQFNISADISPYSHEHSWAVISIQGKPEYVRFVHLSNGDMREIHQFLKRYERTNRTIDSPFQMFKFY